MDESPQVQVKEKLNYLTVSIIGLGYFCINLTLCFYDPTIPVLISKYTKNVFIIGLIGTIAFLISALLQPYMGALSDRTVAKIGKRKLYTLIGMPLSALFLLLISYSNSLAALIVFLIGFNIMFSVYRVPSMSLMPDLTPQKLWSSANGIINLLGGIGALIAYTACAWLLDVKTQYPFFLIAGALIITVLLIQFTVKEKPYEIKSEAERKKEEHIGVFKSFRYILADKDKSALLLLFSIFFRFMGYNGFEGFISLFGINALHVKAGTAMYLLGIMAFAFIIFSLPSGVIAQKIGRKRTVVVGLILMLVTFFICGLAGTFQAIAVKGGFGSLSHILANPFLVIAIMGGLGGLGYAMANTNAYPMLIGMGGDKKVGVYTGLYYFFYSCAAIAAPTLFGFFINWLGYGSMFYVASVFILLAVLTTIGVKRGEAVAKPSEAGAQG